MVEHGGRKVDRPGVLPFDTDTGVPLYQRMKDVLRSCIESGEWPPGHRLPPETTIAELHNMSRTTVRQAILALVQEGLVSRRRGAGTFVRQPKLEADLGSLWDLTRGVLGTGFDSAHQTLQFITTTPDPGVRRVLELPAGEQVHYLERLRLVNNEPVILERFAIPAAMAPGLPETDLSKIFLYPLLVERYGLHLAKAVTWLEPVLVDDYEADLMDVPTRSPAILVRRILYTADGKPTVYMRGTVRGDKCKYVVRSEYPGAPRTQ